MSDQEPTLGEIMRGQVRIELALNTFIAESERNASSFRTQIQDNTIDIALHTQQLGTLVLLKEQVDGVTALANKISGAWALVAIVGAWIVAWWLKHS